MQPAHTLTTAKVHVGDCIETMAKWPADSVDLVFADPPYNIGYKYDQYDDNRPGDDYVQWTEDWISGCVRLLKPTGSLYVLIGDEYAAETRMHLKKLEANGHLAFRNWIIWHYTFGQNCKAKFNRSHAHLFYCVGSAALKKRKKRPTRNSPHGESAPIEYVQQVTVSDPPFTFNKQEVAVPSARQTTYGDRRAKPGGKLPDDTWYLRPQDVDKEGVERYFGPDEDVWNLSRLCGTFKERQGWHPCQLPESLLERIIKLSSNRGDVVFDPFTGSGTTLAVAGRLGRDWVGCELSDEYAKAATKRITHAADTGEKHETTLKEKGIERGKPRKKAEPYRSTRDQVSRDQ